METGVPQFEQVSKKDWSCNISYKLCTQEVCCLAVCLKQTLIFLLRQHSLWKVGNGRKTTSSVFLSSELSLDDGFLSVQLNFYWIRRRSITHLHHLAYILWISWDHMIQTNCCHRLKESWRKWCIFSPRQEIPRLSGLNKISWLGPTLRCFFSAGASGRVAGG